MIVEIHSCAVKQLNDTFSTTIIAKHVEDITKKQFGNINENIPSIRPATSYDIAW